MGTNSKMSLGPHANLLLRALAVLGVLWCSRISEGQAQALSITAAVGLVFLPGSSADADWQALLAMEVLKEGIGGRVGGDVHRRAGRGSACADRQHRLGDSAGVTSPSRALPDRRGQART